MENSPEKLKTPKPQSHFMRVVTGSYSASYQEVLEILAVAVIIVHVVMMFMYHIMNVWELSLYNVIATAYYSYCYGIVREGRVTRGYLLTFLEIIFQMVLTTVVVGWEAGFYTYVIAMMPVYYYISLFAMKNSNNVFRPMAWSLITVIAILASYFVGQLNTPLESLSLVQNSVAFVFNLFLSCMLIIWMSHFFVLGYKKSLDTLVDENASLNDEACMDPLTRLYNRRAMETALESALEDARKTGAIFSLVTSDIDYFKKINDTYGHDCGDVALVAVAEILKACVRDGDTVCRWGGEEFLLLVKGNRSVATTVAERIRSRIENNVVEYEGQQIKFTITLGVSTYSPGYTLEKLLNQADDNLYYGKENGRNQVVATKPKVTSTVDIH